MTDETINADLIREKLVVSQEDIFSNLLDRIQHYIILDSIGDVHFRIDKRQLNQRTAIALYLVGKFFAHKADLVENPEASLEKLAAFINTDEKTVSSRLSELRKDGKVQQVSRGHYRVNYIQIENILDELPPQNIGG